MRLYKKAAAVLLAAAMAVSMMTACGGGAGGGPGVVEGVTYTSNAGLVAGVDENSITNQTSIPMNKSRYAAFMEMTSNPKNPKLYVKLSIANVDNGVLADATDLEVAQTEKYIYQKASYDGQTMEELVEKATNGVYEYTFVDASGRKAAVRLFQKVNSPETPDVPDTSGTPSAQAMISSAQVTVNGNPYYAEIIKSGGTEVVVCYEADKPVPTYEFQTNRSGGKSVAVYNTICFGTDKGTIAQRLSGYTVYTATVDEDSRTKGTLKNETTNVTYDVEATGNTYTVKKDGAPTDEINWLIDGILKELNKKS